MPPSLNNFFGVKVSKTGIPVNQATDKQLVYKDDFSTKTYFDQTNSRMLEGLLPDGSYGLWVSNPGIDVTTADPTLPGQLSFNSNNNTFQILDSGDTTIPAQSLGAGGLVWDSITVPHSLGVTPIVQAFIFGSIGISSGTSVSTYIQLPVNSSTFLTGTTGDIDPDSFFIFATADTNNVYFSYFYFSTPGAGTVPAFPVKYYLLNVSPV